jgi:dinuclear metal center YbgI/SA1388 family protein
MYLIKDIIAVLEKSAPPYYSESYDNTGLICGNKEWKCTGALITLDCIEPVIDEAISSGFNLVIAHHPVVFSGLKKITGADYVERTIIKAIKNDIAVYAMHTNLDNVYQGVNKKICEKLGLINTRILQPKKGVLSKLVTFCPKEASAAVLDALFAAGAGNIGNYSECSFNLEGTGTFKGNEKSNPYVGEKGKRHHEHETRIEVIFESFKEVSVMKALRSSHPYEEIAYYLTKLENEHQDVGSGMIGEFENPMDETAFLRHLSVAFNLKVIRHTALRGAAVSRVAVCGGAGSFLLKSALNAGVQAFVTSDFKYHQFFDAEGKLLIADIGHFESEQFTAELIADELRKNLPTFALRLTKQNTNPVYYFIQHGH